MKTFCLFGFCFSSSSLSPAVISHNRDLFLYPFLKHSLIYSRQFSRNQSTFVLLCNLADQIILFSYSCTWPTYPLRFCFPFGISHITFSTNFQKTRKCCLFLFEQLSRRQNPKKTSPHNNLPMFFFSFSCSTLFLSVVSRICVCGGDKAASWAFDTFLARQRELAVAPRGVQSKRRPRRIVAANKTTHPRPPYKTRKTHDGGEPLKMIMMLQNQTEE